MKFSSIFSNSSSLNCNLLDILPVLFPSETRTRTSFFRMTQYPYFLRTEFLKNSQYPYPYPYQIFKKNPYPYYTRTKNFGFCQYSVLIPFPYMGIGKERVRNPYPYSGVCFRLISSNCFRNLKFSDTICGEMRQNKSLLWDQRNGEMRRFLMLFRRNGLAKFCGI